ncbi:MAG: RNA polymerase sigma factor [Ardenticatenaceae bacterium]|nr:RNA polymerase sigma factor [Ardenticatenaceae bacterium]
MESQLTDQSPSEQVYEACQSDRPEVQTAAFEILWRYLYRVASHMTHSQPDGDALAQDCAQTALVRVHEKLAECREPAALRSWSRRIVSNLVIDRLRRRQRLQPLVIEAQSDDQPARQWADDGPLPDEMIEQLDTLALRQLLDKSPMSDRSRRVVLGRYFDGEVDEVLAQRETELSEKTVKPSHIQVTRAKNIAKLRDWPLLYDFLGKVNEA